MEEETGRKCDLCDKSATKFASPLGSPDEPALCDKHFQEMIERRI